MPKLLYNQRCAHAPSKATRAAKKKRVTKPAMSKLVFVRNTKTKGNYIEIRQDRCCNPG